MSFSPSTANSTMIDSYWDLYIAYIDKCVRDNWVNDIDPHHYEMEWNHLFPKCVFGDWPVGHWLTKRQHAIASALQTLAFERNCMCRWHKKNLPHLLIELAWPYFKKQCADNGRNNIKAMNGHPNTTANRSEVAKTMNDHPNTIANRSENAKVMNGHPNTTASRSENAKVMNGHVNTKERIKRSCKRILLTSITTGESLEFPSASEAARALGLSQGHLCEVARGVSRHHKEYTAVYLA